METLNGEVLSLNEIDEKIKTENITTKKLICIININLIRIFRNFINFFLLHFDNIVLLCVISMNQYNL